MLNMLEVSNMVYQSLSYLSYSKRFKMGSNINKNLEEAHIPLEEFEFKGW